MIALFVSFVLLVHFPSVGSCQILPSHTSTAPYILRPRKGSCKLQKGSRVPLTFLRPALQPREPVSTAARGVTGNKVLVQAQGAWSLA